jgi:hypothetical protein
LDRDGDVVVGWIEGGRESSRDRRIFGQGGGEFEVGTDLGGVEAVPGGEERGQVGGAELSGVAGLF